LKEDEKQGTKKIGHIYRVIIKEMMVYDVISS
jgi:hypothetical protein